MRAQVFLVLSLIFAWSRSNAIAGESPLKRVDRLEASVNSGVILSSDIQRFRDTFSLRMELDPLFASSSLAQSGGKPTESEMIGALVQDRLILEAFPVTDTEVEQEINSIQSSSRISRDRLKAALAEKGARFEDYFELIRLSTAKRNLIDREIRSKVSISEDDVKNQFYNRIARQGNIPLTYKVQIISISRSSFNSAKAVTDAAERAQTAIKAGDSFDEVAKRYSDDATAASGGDLGSLTEDQMSPAIKKEIKTLKVGQVSATIGDPNQRVIILRLADISSGDDARFQKVRDEIRNQLTAAEYQKQIQFWIERQERQAFIHRARTA